MSIDSSPGSTSLSSSDPNKGMLEMALGSSMKRLLSVNDAYGVQVLRVAIMDELNELVRKSRAILTMNDVTTAFENLVELAKGYGRNRVMREALIIEHSNLSAFVQRMV